MEGRRPGNVDITHIDGGAFLRGLPWRDRIRGFFREKGALNEQSF
jgi:hypothetical protein